MQKATIRTSYENSKKKQLIKENAPLQDVMAFSVRISQCHLYFLVYSLKDHLIHIRRFLQD